MGAQVCLGLESVVLDNRFGCWSGRIVAHLRVKCLQSTWVGDPDFPFSTFQPWNLTSSFVSNMWVFCVNVWMRVCTCSCVRGYMCEFKCTYLCIPVEWRSQPQVVQLCRHPQVSEIGSCTGICMSLTRYSGSLVFPENPASLPLWCWH